MVTGIPGKTGIVYTLDARTGEFLWGPPDHAPEPWCSRSTGPPARPTIDRPQALFNKVGDTRFICPRPRGEMQLAGEEASSAPKTGLMYIPMQNTRQEYDGGAGQAEPVSWPTASPRPGSS